MRNRNQTYRLMICRNLCPAAEPIVKYLWLLLLFAAADELISAADNTMSPRSLGFRPFDRMFVVVVVTWWFVIANHRRLSTFSIVLELLLLLLLLLLSFVVLLSSSSLSNRSTTVSISAVWVWVWICVWVRFVKSSSSFFSSFLVIIMSLSIG